MPAAADGDDDGDDDDSDGAVDGEAVGDGLPPHAATTTAIPASATRPRIHALLDRNSLNAAGLATVLGDMTIARLVSLLAALAIILLVVAACAEGVPTPTGGADGGDGSGPAATPPRSTGRPDPSEFANAATYAAWRRSPVRPTPDFAAAVEAACRSEDAVGDLPLQVLDARGEGRAILVFADAKAGVACAAQDDRAGSVAVQTHPVPGVKEAKPPAVDGDLGVHEMYVVDAGGSTYSVLVGQYNPKGVKDVSANFDADAAWYTAASSNGWYAIWWPGEAQPLGVATANNRAEVIDSYAP